MIFDPPRDAKVQALGAPDHDADADSGCGCGSGCACAAGDDPPAETDGQAPSSSDESTTDDVRMDVTFLLNGQPVTLHVFPDELLLQVLYDVYDIDFAHDGCHAGTCGTCTSVVNGVLVKICVLPMRDVAGKSVYVKVKNGARGRHNGKRG